jgi:hypothetical protein
LKAKGSHERPSSARNGVHGDPKRGPDGAADASDPSGESAPDGASKPDGGDGRGEPGPSRRGAAQAIKDRDAEIERLVEEREAERRKADEANKQAASLNQQHQAARKAALDLIGDDAVFRRLQSARLRNQPLTYAEDEALDRMLQYREHAQTFWELADRGHKVEMAKGLADRIERHGLDRDTAFGAALPDLIDHAVSVTEARVRKESAERIAELEQQVKGLKPRAAAAGRAAPTTGGGSGNGARMPEDGASPLEWFSSGLRDGSHRRAGAGRR